MGQLGIQRLMAELQRLWRQLLDLFWQRRLQKGQAGEQPQPEAFRPLSEFIVLEQDSGSTDAGGAGQQPATDYDLKPMASQTKGPFDNLARHLRGRRRSASMQPGIADRLQQSTWEHTRAAARAAKSGNREGARLHAELAENALQEAGRYMPVADYRRFRRELEISLQRSADR